MLSQNLITLKIGNGLHVFFYKIYIFHFTDFGM